MYIIYTDGSTKGNGRAQNNGGWAYVIVRDEITIHQDSGSMGGTTNQRMELTACLRALEYCSKELCGPGETFSVHSDSAYLINCYTQKWWQNWEKNGWRNARGEAVANQELWKQIIPYFTNKDYHFHKVKGHANDRLNIYADKLAQAAADGKMLSRDELATEGFV